MRVFGWLGAALLVGAVTVGSVDAATLSSPHMFTQDGEFLICTITNVSKKPLATVDMRVIDNGVLMAQKSCPNLPPGHTCFLFAPFQASGYCSVVTSGGKSRVRGIANTRKDGQTNYSAPIQ